MNGVIEKKYGNNSIIEICFLSEELKQKIKEELTIICHGEYALISESSHYSFESTIKELVNYRIPDNKIKKIGAIGELLLNVMIRSFTDLEIISPFFNVEERNVKKGFDIIAIDSSNNVWIIESKAGELGQQKNVTDKVCERIRTAKNDLNKRLNENNSQLWLNAIKCVRSALDDRSEKATIVKILEKTSNCATSNDKNVVLGGTVFCMFDSKIDGTKFSNLYDFIVESHIFLDLKLIAIQKQTYQAIFKYLCELIQE